MDWKPHDYLRILKAAIDLTCKKYIQFYQEIVLKQALFPFLAAL